MIKTECVCEIRCSVLKQKREEGDGPKGKDIRFPKETLRSGIKMEVVLLF